jgi:DNA repair exonuclease SbcCD ATPase subunit
VAFICLQLLGLAIVGVSPWLVNFLPNRISLTSDTAPPPQNPRLQYCLEDYLFQQYDAREAELMTAIDGARQLDLSYLPKDMQKNAAKAFEQAGRTFPLVADVRAAEAAVAARAGAYTPLRDQVRRIERNIARVNAEIEETGSRIARMSSASEEERATLPALDAQVRELEARRGNLQAQVPERWAEQRKLIQALQKQEDNARRAYRRNVDNAYGPVSEIVAVVAATDLLEAARADIEDLKDIVGSAEPDAAAERINEVARAVGAIEGARDIRSLLSKARRAIRGKTPEPEKALQLIDEALAEHAAEMAWRRQAKVELLPGLEAYELAIRDTIGLRQQPRRYHRPAPAAAPAPTAGQGNRGLPLAAPGYFAVFLDRRADPDRP